MTKKNEAARTNLGRITSSTRGNVFGVTEQIGLYQPSVKLSDR